MTLRHAVEARSLRAAMSAPAKVQRLIAGRPVVKDGQTLAPDLQVLLRLQSLVRPRDEEVPFDELRVRLREESPLVGGVQPIGATRDLVVAGRPARHYLPTRPAVTDGPGPLLVFVHGGGFVEGDLDTHDAPCRVLAEQTGVPVLAITYRLAPEHRFPAAHDDAYEGFRWVVDHAAELGADPQRLAVGGDSAGANLAANIALAAARDGVPLRWQLLVYPVADGSHDTASMRLFGEGFYLTRTFIDRVDVTYPRTPDDLADPRISLVRAELPDGLPDALAPAYVVTAGFDPLRDEGEAYARGLADAGATVELRRFTDQIHGFLNIVGTGRTSRAAVLEIAGRMRSALL
ncbi:alpha/beta hydrolase [Nocardioides sp. TF02-7]|uniref:alpha/beta hydrolase n=1 Tax=Nocardioides sp. TF02-7 TaxID=2917724 RepID=UPI001F064EEF|nr:alpha/beta hydrolase [Nocardioides sp. TF02-7]UMG91099.1 alpha/beta hydrolase [Nocardioides sp. TF02-7]